MERLNQKGRSFTRTYHRKRRSEINGKVEVFSDRVNGHKANGHKLNGKGLNGHGTNGHKVNGHKLNGHGLNGHKVNGNNGHDQWVSKYDPKYPYRPIVITAETVLVLQKIKDLRREGHGAACQCQVCLEIKPRALRLNLVRAVYDDVLGPIPDDLLG